jgi:hypothetical protein
MASQAPIPNNYLWECTLVMCLLGILLLVVGVAMAKYFQLSRIQRAIEKAWFNPGICPSLSNDQDCRLHYIDGLANLPTSSMAVNTFEPLVARKLVDFVSRIEMSQDQVAIAVPTNHVQVDHYKPVLSPTFGTAHMYGTDVMILSFRCTVTHTEIQNDLYAYQKIFDTGRVHSPKFPSKLTPEYINGTESYVHAGFYNIYQRYRANVVQTIKNHRPKYIYITGHSLGGSVATLFSVFLAELAEQEAFQHIEGVSGYVFGTPRVGNNHFHQRLLSCPKLKNFWRIVNKYDNIQDLPLKVTPNFQSPDDTVYYYEHSGGEYTYERNWGSWQKNHFLPNYIYELQNLISAD